MNASATNLSSRSSSVEKIGTLRSMSVLGVAIGAILAEATGGREAGANGAEPVGDDRIGGLGARRVARDGGDELVALERE